MTTREHVYELVDRIDAEGLDVERLDEDQLEALAIELSSILLRFGRRHESGHEPETEPEAEPEDDRDERPYDPLGALIGFIGPDDYDGPTDVSTNKYKYVADAIQHW